MYERIIFSVQADNINEKGLFVAKPDKKRTILAKKSVFRTSGGKPDQSISSGKGIFLENNYLKFYNSYSNA